MCGVKGRSVTNNKMRRASKAKAIAAAEDRKPAEDQERKQEGVSRGGGPLRAKH